MAGGPFRPGDDPRRRSGRAEPNKRTAEIEQLCEEIIERRGGVDGLLARYFSDDVDPKLQFEAIKLILGYRFGLPRQRVTVSGDAPVAVVIRRAGVGCDPAGAAPAPVDDCERPGALPGDLGGATMGEDPDGV